MFNTSVYRRSIRFLLSLFTSFIMALFILANASPQIHAQTETKPLYGIVFQLANPDENDMQVAFVNADGAWTTQKLPAVFDYSYIEFNVNRPHWLSDGRIIGTGFAEDVPEIDWDTPRSHLYIYDPFTDELNSVGDNPLMVLEDGTFASWQLIGISPDEKYAVLTVPFATIGKLIIVDLETETISAEFDDAFLQVLDIQGTQFLLANAQTIEFWLVDVRSPATDVRIIPDVYADTFAPSFILEDNKLLLQTFDSIKLLDSAHEFAEIWTLPNATALKLSANRNLMAAYLRDEREIVWADIPNNSIDRRPVEQLMNLESANFEGTSAFDFVGNTFIYWEATELENSGNACLILRHELSDPTQLLTSIPYYAHPEQACGPDFSVSPNLDALVEYLPETGSIIVHQGYQPADLPTDQQTVDIEGNLFETTEPLWSSEDHYPDVNLTLANLYAAEPIPFWGSPTYTRDGNWLYLYQESSTDPNYMFINIYDRSSYYLSIPYSADYRYITSSPDGEWLLTEWQDSTTGQTIYSVFNSVTGDSQDLLASDNAIMARLVDEVNLYYFVAWSPIWTE